MSSGCGVKSAKSEEFGAFWPQERRTTPFPVQRGKIGPVLASPRSWSSFARRARPRPYRAARNDGGPGGAAPSKQDQMGEVRPRPRGVEQALGAGGARRVGIGPGRRSGPLRAKVLPDDRGTGRVGKAPQIDDPRRCDEELDNAPFRPAGGQIALNRNAGTFRAERGIERGLARMMKTALRCADPCERSARMLRDHDAPDRRGESCGGRDQSACAARNRSASSAAIQPIPAEVTACRYTWSVRSPAAKTPGTDVSVLPGLTVT